MLAYVALHCHGLATVRPDRVDDVQGLLTARPVIDRNEHASVRQKPGGGGTDTPARSGDQGNPV
jgi:hypothetical protein